MTPQQFVALLVSNIINPLLYVLFAAAMIIFIWGIVEFLYGKSKGDAASQEKGWKHLVFGLIGLFVMLTAASIIGLVVTTIGGTWPPGSNSYYNCTNGGSFGC